MDRPLSSSELKDTLMLHVVNGDRLSHVIPSPAVHGWLVLR